jgi:N utilization substance protein A
MKLFEMEVPEIYDSTVSIVSVARDAGERSKVAVKSKDRDVDPVGACVGMKGSRVQAVIRELRGEKIDIVQYDEDGSLYVRNALNPAAINRVGVRSFEDREMEVIVAEDQLSLAIGKRGQNVRLAGKLVGWNLDIKSEAEKKAEVEAEMERMATASQQLARLPDIEPAISSLLLDAGFRTVEEVSLASLDDLTTIEGIDEDTAIGIHDSAEVLAVEIAAEDAARREQEKIEQAAAEQAAAEQAAAEQAAAEQAAAEQAAADEAAAEQAEDERGETEQIEEPTNGTSMTDDAAEEEAVIEQMATGDVGDEPTPEAPTVADTDDATTERPDKTQA